ncbi:MAG: hypothetical protein V1809_00230 [Planctomycetota bacterium]
MNDSILLSRQHGLNPCLLVCPRCGKDSGEIALLGRSMRFQCLSCRKNVIGTRPLTCPFCGTGDFDCLGEFDGMGQRLPGSLCEECQKEVSLLKAEIANGGVPWRCRDCKREGVIKAESAFAKEFRLKHPGFGCEFDKTGCPMCWKEDPC